MIKARPLRFASLALTAAAAFAGLVALPPAASADRFRVRVGGGGARVRVNGPARVRIGGPGVVYRRGVYGPRYGVPYYRPRPYARYYPRPYYYPYYYYPYYYYPGFSFSFHYAYPPPAGCYYECGPGAYYYGAPPPAAVVKAAPAPKPELPRVGLGVFGGSVDVEGKDAGNDLGLLGRVRLASHLLLEAEVAKTEFADGVRLDRRVGGALLLDLAPYSPLSLYLLGGGGFGQTDVDHGTFKADQAYGELGVGLEWRLNRHLAVLGDVRGGVRDTNASQDDLLMLRTGPAASAIPTVDDNEHFARARIGALVYF